MNIYSPQKIHHVLYTSNRKYSSPLASCVSIITSIVSNILKISLIFNNNKLYPAHETEQFNGGEYIGMFQAMGKINL